MCICVPNLTSTALLVLKICLRVCQFLGSRNLSHAPFRKKFVYSDIEQRIIYKMLKFNLEQEIL